jgi:lipopolysaccharide/colanic/teichoic acid biosynthesis glycosyltransferase
VFYTQERIGLNRRRRNRRAHNVMTAKNSRKRDRRRENHFGRPFSVIKFRTMVNNAEANTGAVWASKNDARITRIGKILRKTRIDEVPQLINVLRGEMALVGPRPERPVFVKDLADKVPNYTERLNVKPGITGRAQVDNGYDTSVESVARKIEYDVDYIRNWTVWSDIKILLKTVVVVITGKGAC